MTPKELREIAQKSTENEYALLNQSLVKAAESGNHSFAAGVVSDAVIAKLRKEGFTIELDVYQNTVIISW